VLPEALALVDPALVDPARMGLDPPSSPTPHASMARVLYLRVRDDPELVKIEQQPGTASARRRSVHWILLPNSAD
jgi:hypothetical protein